MRPADTSTKADIMRAVCRGEAREIFHHSALGYFDVTVMRAAIARVREFKTVPTYRCRFDEVRLDETVEFDGDPNDHLILNREVDQARVTELTGQDLEEPLIFIDVPAGVNGDAATQLLVDGVHRYVARRRRGMPDFEFYLIPLEAAPRVENPGDYESVPWGTKDVQPGVGLVPRRKP